MVRATTIMFLMTLVQTTHLITLPLHPHTKEGVHQVVNTTRMSLNHLQAF